MATTCKLIAKTTLGSTAADVTLSSIPQTYDDLVILYSARVASSGTSFVLKARVNGATADTSHSCRELYGEGSGAPGSRSLSYLSVGWAPGTSATADTFSSAEIYIPNYTGSSNKSFSSCSVLENNATYGAATVVAGLWSSSSAISSLTLLPSSGTDSFASGSSFYLYGITKA
jgi:hypothetical protein